MSRLLMVFFTLGLIGSALARYHPSIKTYEQPLIIQGRDIVQSLHVNNPYHDAGVWGDIEVCPDGSFASAIEVKYDPPSHLDETAINGVKLYCTTPVGQDTGYVTSCVRPRGLWFGMQVCSSDFITGFRANILAYQGLSTDDVAVENIQVSCNYGEEIIDGIPIPVPVVRPNPLNFKAGDWSAFANCSDGLAVCGVQTRYEEGSVGDDVAIADVVLYCCNKS